MRIVTQANARAMWYVPTEDLNPNGLDLVPVYAAIQGRYRFRVFPTKPEDLQPVTGGVVFAKGSFRLSEDELIEVVRFEIFSDGLMLDTRHSTEASDVVLEDILAFSTKTHRLVYDPSMIRKKVYVSEVVATTNLNLASLSPKFGQFANLLAEVCGEKLEFQPDMIRFGTDSGQRPVSLKFRFERRDGSRFVDNRYFSLAPTTTEKHQQLLDAMEVMLSE
ncbi:MAG TPA: hypothetical protein VIX89_02820 [Bryobacteraceae bacterium]